MSCVDSRVVAASISQFWKVASLILYMQGVYLVHQTRVSIIRCLLSEGSGYIA